MQMERMLLLKMVLRERLMRDIMARLFSFYCADDARLHRFSPN